MDIISKAQPVWTEYGRKGKKMKQVLIAEDSDMLIMTLQAGFKKYASTFEPVFVKDGLEAIEVLKKQQISLLVTDLQMPRVEGLVLLAYMNQNHPTIPCIVMTATRRPQLKQRLQHDVLSYIEKPFTPDELAKTIISSLDQDIPGGSLYGISIVNFLQMIEMEKKTCLLEVNLENHPSGAFYFEKGVLHHAEYGKLKGEDAAIKMIQLDRVRINFKKVPKRKIERRIRKDMTDLLLKTIPTEDELEQL